MFDQHRRRKQMINRHPEKSLNLRCVQIHRQNAVRPRRHQKIRHQLRRDRHPRLIDEMHKLRRNVFHDRLRWQVTVINRWEIDGYDALDPLYAKRLGVNTEDLLVSQPSSGEEALRICEALVKSNAIDVIVVDSVAALVPKAELEGDMGDSLPGLQARLMSQALRKLTATISKTNTICIFINQLREKIGVMFGNPETTTGGNALKFYSSVRLDIRRMAQIKDGDEAVGNRVKVKVVKNKVAPPFRAAEFDIVFGEGISKSGEIIDMGVELGIISKSGSWFSYNNDKLGQGREGVKQLLRDNPELSNELEAKIREKIKEMQAVG